MSILPRPEPVYCALWYRPGAVPGACKVCLITCGVSTWKIKTMGGVVPHESTCASAQENGVGSSRGRDERTGTRSCPRKRALQGIFSSQRSRETPRDDRNHGADLYADGHIHWRLPFPALACLTSPLWKDVILGMTLFHAFRLNYSCIYTP